MQPSKPFKSVVGIAVTLAIITSTVLGTQAALGQFSDRYELWVTLGETGQGIIGGSDVVMRGVIVGEVGQIRLDDELQAEVQLLLEPHLTVADDAVIAVTGKTLLGEKQVEIRQDRPLGVGPQLADGGLIDDPGQVVELQDVLEDLDILLGAIDPQDLAILVTDGLGAIDGSEDAIARAVDQGARATDVLSRSLDDQIPAVGDLSLVAEELGTRGEDFNRLAAVIDAGALGTITDNQQQLRTLLGSLDRFSDQLDVVLELTRPDLDRLIVEGDNVSRLLFAYRPELADLVVGIDFYTELFGDLGLTDPGFAGNGAGFQILLDEDPASLLCGGVPPEIAAGLPLCEGTPAPPPAADEPGVSPAPDPGLPDLDELIPEATGRGLGLQVDPSPAAPAPPGGIGAVLDGLLRTTG